ncbi:hypothetical protein [Limosilactobacillus reuteri]|uniref:hypothetical protein n=1 Tax=Limosilactobacillus reuteri TaxID=1598 RepID=UPI002B061821|nr:hypothetical protein [Limosilactobacillus reuteri]
MQVKHNATNIFPVNAPQIYPIPLSFIGTLIGNVNLTSNNVIISHVIQNPGLFFILDQSA